jgi:hypothetical protein
MICSGGCECLSGKKSSKLRSLEKKQFLSEETNQKTFSIAPAARLRSLVHTTGIASRAKVFWFFSSEKNCFLPHAVEFA